MVHMEQNFLPANDEGRDTYTSMNLKFLNLDFLLPVGIIGSIVFVQHLTRSQNPSY